MTKNLFAPNTFNLATQAAV